MRDEIAVCSSNHYRELGRESHYTQAECSLKLQLYTLITEIIGLFVFPKHEAATSQVTPNFRIYIIGLTQSLVLL